MEEKKEIPELLELVLRPGFCVKENKITAANQAARGLLLEPGMDILPLLKPDGRNTKPSAAAACI